MPRHEHILQRIQRSWPGEHFGGRAGLDRLMQRDAPLPELRPVAGESFRGIELKVRSAARVVEPGEPAPLLMRLMWHKQTLDPGFLRRIQPREPREARLEVEAGEPAMRLAQEERGVLDRPAPVRVWRGTTPPRGMSAARPALTGGR